MFSISQILLNANFLEVCAKSVKEKRKNKFKESKGKINKNKNVKVNHLYYFIIYLESTKKLKWRKICKANKIYSLSCFGINEVETVRMINDVKYKVCKKIFLILVIIFNVFFFFDVIREKRKKFTKQRPPLKEKYE